MVLALGLIFFYGVSDLTLVSLERVLITIYLV